MSAFTARLLVNLAFAGLTLNWNVRKARKAFEKQLISQGMSKKDARRLSAQYSLLKNDIMSALRVSAFRNR
jgi:DNA polymerase III delta prime subunit